MSFGAHYGTRRSSWQLRRLSLTAVREVIDLLNRLRRLNMLHRLRGRLSCRLGRLRSLNRLVVCEWRLSFFCRLPELSTDVLVRLGAWQRRTCRLYGGSG